MTTNVTYRDAGAVVPTSTTVKGAPLSNSEIDGNFKSLVNSVDAKVDSTDLAAPSGAALVGADTGLTYAAGTVGAMLKSLQSSITTLSGQIAGILDGATFTGPISLPGNAVDNLHAVPLQQLNAAVAAIPAAVGNYAPAFFQWRDIVNLYPAVNQWVDFSGGVLQAHRNNAWSTTGIGIKAQAPGFIKVTVSGVSINRQGAGQAAFARVRVKLNATYINPELYVLNDDTNDGRGGDLFVIVPVSVGDVVKVGYLPNELISGTVQSVACQAIAFEYFGPTT